MSEDTKGFINPYNFVPVAIRRPEGLQDAAPCGHHVLAEDRYSGYIRVRMTAVTPLLVPGHFKVSDDGHKTFWTRLGNDGRPLIPSTSVKGMLRSAFEAITNSRFGVYSSTHSERFERGKPERKIKDAHSPHDCTPAMVLPAATRDELSAADRVFGWVASEAADDRRSTWAGLLTLGPVHCDTNDGFNPVEAGPYTLAILSSPKSKQVAFYCAKPPSDVSVVLPSQLSKNAKTYSKKETTVRGRKIYPHHANWPGEGLNAPTIDQKSDQNSSWADRVKVNTAFTFELTLRNLSKMELGALVYLLTLREGLHHRFGGAKPLGFGSVRLTIDQHGIATGEEWRHSLHQMKEPDTSLDLGPIRDGFVTMMREGKPKLGGILDAFEAAAAGWDGESIHYPRQQVDALDKGFEWFMGNDRADADRRQVLPPLGTEAPLLKYQQPGSHSWTQRGGGPRR